MGLGQARAPGRDVVNDKTALVHGGQEFALQALIDADAQEQHHARRRRASASDGARPRASPNS